MEKCPNIATAAEGTDCDCVSKVCIAKSTQWVLSEEEKKLILEALSLTHHVHCKEGYNWAVGSEMRLTALSLVDKLEDLLAKLSTS